MTVSEIDLTRRQALGVFASIPVVLASGRTVLGHISREDPHETYVSASEAEEFRRLIDVGDLVKINGHTHIVKSVHRASETFPADMFVSEPR